ncbi:ParB N-terminal domain-containing protein [Cohnella faecalis]|uniref:Uncharacterized protein n=1 Tax=Cohnella faecalis TaxID=2315694 RepID=A0A398CK52_9BACL|nr:ParB N-terminal domain-containing protein [Cohnella faecalis]RIE01248.1 hypothetical protein D3H35_22930 [Cohnella faecalis]
MKYGSTKIAMAYAERGAIAEWIQLFLRNDGKNVALADGLLLEQRYYIGPIITDISAFGIEEGAPSYLTDVNDIAWFFHVVDRMKEMIGDWDMPPLIVQYDEDQYEINDGRHRNEALRQLKITNAPVVFWMSSEEDHRFIVEQIRGDKR